MLIEAEIRSFYKFLQSNISLVGCGENKCIVKI